MQETWVWSQIWEDPPCCGATKLVHRDYWACALGPESCSYWAHMLQPLKPVRLGAGSLQQEGPLQWEAKGPLSNEDSAQPKIDKIIFLIQCFKKRISSRDNHMYSTTPPVFTGMILCETHTHPQSHTHDHTHTWSHGPTAIIFCLQSTKAEHILDGCPWKWLK